MLKFRNLLDGIVESDSLKTGDTKVSTEEELNSVIEAVELIRRRFRTDPDLLERVKRTVCEKLTRTTISPEFQKMICSDINERQSVSDVVYHLEYTASTFS